MATVTKQDRYYQNEAHDAVFEALTKRIKNQMLVMATGTGKTFTATKISKQFKRCLWITHTEELIGQSAKALLISEYVGDTDALVDAMKKFTGVLSFMDAVEQQLSTVFKIPELENVDCKQVKSLLGIIKEKRMDLDAKIVVASIQTLHRRLDKIDPKQFDLIIVDECHMATAKTWTKAIEHFSYDLLLGLTATPYRSDGMSLGNIFDKIVYEYDILKGINDGFLCELNAIRVKTNINLDSVGTVAGELNQGQLKIVDCGPRNQLIVDSYIQYASGRQAIVFCVDVEHAIHVTEAFRERGIKCEFVVGDKKICPDRPERIGRFTSGETDILSNCMVLTAGFDHPEVGCIIMACPTKSLTKYVQCIGRGTRLKLNLKDCVILDMVDVTSKHRLVNSFSLDHGKKIEDRIFLTSEKKQQLIDARDKRMAKIDAHELANKDKRVNLFTIPKVKAISSEKMKEPATEKQLAWIAKLGYDILNTAYTKQMCSDIISNQPASDAAIFKLRSEGYIIPPGLTLAEAKAAFAEIDEKAGKVLSWKEISKNPIEGW